MKIKFKSVLGVLLAVLMLSSCSGGGSGDSADTPNADVSTGERESTSSDGESEASETETETETETEAPETKETITEEMLRETYSLAVEKAKYQAKKLYVVDQPSELTDKVTLAVLQGLTANMTDEQIFIKTGSFDTYRDFLAENYDVEIISGGETWSLLKKYADKLDGYILCGNYVDSASIPVAISLSKQLNAVAVSKKNEDKAKAAGLTMVLDATDKDDDWLRNSEYFENLNKKIAVEQPISMIPKLADYAAMTGAYFNFYDGHIQKHHRNMYKFLDDNAVVFGYNNTLGEFDTVDSFSRDNISMIPSDHAYNLSVLSGFCRDTLKQKREEVEYKGGNVHSLCLILSDGDNLQWMTNDFLTSDKWFNSPLRGSFPFGWGVPATAIDTVSPILEKLYDEAKTGDEFIMELSGIGYTFPSRWKDEALDEMTSQLADYMKRSDLKYAEILDDGGFKKKTLSHFTSKDGIDGVFYIDYGNYAEYKGKILWSDEKPCVSARYRLWGGLDDGTIESISAKLNALPTDPTNENAYTFIIVHAWSGSDGSGKITSGGKTLEGVRDLLAALDDDIEVVTPDEFMTRIKTNLGGK